MFKKETTKSNKSTFNAQNYNEYGKYKIKAIFKVLLNTLTSTILTSTFLWSNKVKLCVLHT